MSLVVDSSVWIAVLMREPERGPFLAALKGARPTVQGAVTWLEASMVARGRLGEVGARLLESLRDELEVRIVPFDESQAAVALDAFARFGKGRHRASLNLGDCCSYAVSRTLRLPLLCKGDDFPRTDLELAAF